jgi:L-seryl-tRNA(Ser) seleniumtransferase
MNDNRFSSLPQVERLLGHPSILPHVASLSRPLVAKIVADIVEKARSEMRTSGGEAPSADELASRAEAACRRLGRRRILRVINGTGVILHTNLGRSPLPAAVWRAAEGKNSGYSNLELDLESGRRGQRSGIVPQLLELLIGCEDSLVVNNNAAAILLMLSALARGRDVLVSRGEQVQIGGGFRIPDILALSGARLVEVGTTNVTTIDDYLAAVGDNTAMVLLVHTSNFAIRGFTEKPDPRELAKRLPPEVILAVDQGSGCTTENLPGEVAVKRYREAGAGLVCFSADKLLGGPQAGIIAGDAALVARLSSHPLLRAFRVGKTIYSLLEEFLVRRLNGDLTGWTEATLALPRERLLEFGERICRTLPAGRWKIVDLRLASGGGSAPDSWVPSPGLELSPSTSPESLLRSLRELPVPIIGTISANVVRLSLATMNGEDPEFLSASIAAALAEEEQPCR